MRVYIFRIFAIDIAHKTIKGCADDGLIFFERKYSHFFFKSGYFLFLWCRYCEHFLIRGYQLIVCQAGGINFLLKRRELLLKGILKTGYFRSINQTFLIIQLTFCLGKFTFEGCQFF